MNQHCSAAALRAAEADAPPPIIGVAEIALTQVNGIALAQDGSAVGLRGVDGSGQPVAITFPADMVDVVAAALKQAMAKRLELGQAALQPKLPISHPGAFAVSPAGDQFDGVVIAFDPGPDAQLYGLPLQHVAAFVGAVADAGAKQQKSRKRLIIPNG